ncbi:MAG TPA: pyrophosphatase [Methylomirabilota bacterium]|nr:pyrophosphatase [Methylomirabilota bacterium]
MDIDRYAEWAARIPIGRPPIRAEAALLSYLCIGLASESGELAGVVKKRLRDGQWNPEQAADELGDVAYYFARLCAALGKQPSEVLDRSVAKIAARLKTAESK